MTKTLYILRHAKAEAGDISIADIERPLAQRGLDDASRLATWVSEKNIIPQCIGCSSSERTRQTLDQMRDVLPGVLVDMNERLYLATCGELISYVQAFSEDINSAMLIGHNPGLHELVLTLMRDADQQAASIVGLKFPTCALAVIEYEGEWKALAPQMGYLKYVWTPKTA